jgi:hypothetical protein
MFRVYNLCDFGNDTKVLWVKTINLVELRRRDSRMP